jgi:AcrR family transcriptional regulator
MSRDIAEQIVKASAAIFADYGYYGATTRDIAKKAGVAEPSVYRLFKTKERLFEETLLGTVNSTLDPAQFLLIIYEHEQKHEKFSVLAMDAVRKWYSSLPEQSARLLMQAALSRNEKWRAIAHSRTQKIIQLLADAIDRETRRSKTKTVSGFTAARMLILSLYDFRLTRAILETGEKEHDVLEKTVRQWLEGLSVSG